ncbi:hypothetical protein B0A48_08745 [Cryoendolithus antarcticus]|uniref:Interferon-related developmental regulator N-terminal domain-containing protein n=1 Tax=Cryoendolithus antarcticus TaxID=1507870 RepID=A0A1V8T416_9PEZI|nr:hypothetical protein B0A48_08745 [Cryoendolithus antarcticus]
MHDLRKQVLLESGKTQSRKQRSKQGTPAASSAGSPTPSRSGSRVPSRNVSDDESEGSDASAWGTTSLEDLQHEEDAHTPADVVIADLYQRIDAICDRKRSSAEGREIALAGLGVDLQRYVAKAELGRKLDELVPAIMKSVKAGQSDKETVQALKALALILVTSTGEALYTSTARTVQSLVTDSPEPTIKHAAIQAFGTIAFFGDAPEDDIEESMDLLLEIISSDGSSIDCPDNASIVTAALQTWGLLATKIQDLEDITEGAMEAFTDQLQSSDAEVQIAAGEDIAFLFERSYTEAEEDEAPPSPSSDSSDHANGNGPHMIQRYTAHRQPELLISQLEALAQVSSKRLSKKSRRALHQTFSDVLATVEKPTRGPRYSKALDEDGREYGSRLNVAVGGKGGRSWVIDKWWMYLRLGALRTVLQGGLLVHLEGNEGVRDALEQEFAGIEG